MEGEDTSISSSFESSQYDSSEESTSMMITRDKHVKNDDRERLKLKYWILCLVIALSLSILLIIGLSFIIFNNMSQPQELGKDLLSKDDEIRQLRNFEYPFITHVDGKRLQGTVTIPNRITDPKIIYDSEGMNQVMLIMGSDGIEFFYYEMTFNPYCCPIDGKQGYRTTFEECILGQMDIDHVFQWPAQTPQEAKSGFEKMMRETGEEKDICQDDRFYFVVDVTNMVQISELFDCQGRCEQSTFGEFIEENSALIQDVEEEGMLEEVYRQYEDNIQCNDLGYTIKIDGAPSAEAAEGQFDAHVNEFCANAVQLVNDEDDRRLTHFCVSSGSGTCTRI